MSVTHFRDVLRITGRDSPNVKLALREIAAGLQPSGTTVVPGVLSWANYCQRVATLDPQRRCESIDAEWYEGPEQKLVPDGWLKFAAEYATSLPGRRAGRKWLGVDPGEGGDDSAWCLGDRLGVLALVSLKTPDTNSVFGRTCLLVRENGIDWKDVIFDLGGGGKEHVDRFRAAGFPVRGVRFGTIKREVKRSMTLFQEKRDVEEDTAGYSNRRSEMAYAVRMLLERPSVDQSPEVLEATTRMSGVKKTQEKPPYGLPLPLCEELFRQLKAVPLLWDDQGRFKLIPKNPPAGSPDADCFRKRIGRSPDQFDAFCLMVHGMTNEPIRTVAGSN